MRFSNVSLIRNFQNCPSKWQLRKLKRLKYDSIAKRLGYFERFLLYNLNYDTTVHLMMLK